MMCLFVFFVLFVLCVSFNPNYNQKSFSRNVSIDFESKRVFDSLKSVYEECIAMIFLLNFMRILFLSSYFIILRSFRNIEDSLSRVSLSLASNGR